MNLIHYFWLFLELKIVFSLSLTDLKQVHILFRHGERAPTKTYKNDPYVNYTWPGGLGHLTYKGKFEIFNLGKKIRDRYNDFLGSFYFPSNLTVFSSYADRCLMSAQLFNAGLFPPVKEQIWNPELLWQPIPVYYTERINDTFVAMKKPCPKFDHMLADLYKNSPEIIDLNKKHAELYKYLSKHTGQTVDNIEKVEILYNTLTIEQLNNLTLPNWVNNTILDTMLELAAKNLALYSHNDYMKRIKGGMLVKRVIASMEKIIDRKPEARFFIYSGHDISIVHLMKTLNLVEDNLKPDFGAAVIFELYEIDKEFIIKIQYLTAWNGDFQEQIIKNCGSGTYCTLGDFRKSMENMLPVDYDKECQE